MSGGARRAALAAALACASSWAVLVAAAPLARAQSARAGSGSGSASASPRPAWLAGSPPAGWSEIASLSRSVGISFRQSAPFGDLPGRAGALAHAERGVGAFYLSWMEADQAAPGGAEAIRGAFDRLRAGRAVSSPEASSTEEIRYAERVDAGIAVADLEWRHVSNETLSLVRAFAWLSADGKPRLAAAECVVSTTDGKPPPAVEKTCRDALGSVSIAGPAAGRAALTALPPGRAEGGGERLAVGESGAAAAAGEPPGTAGRSSPQATVGPVSPGANGRVLYRGPGSSSEEGSSSRWLITLGALLVVVALYLVVRARRVQQIARASDDDAVAAADPADLADLAADGAADDESRADRDGEADEEARPPANTDGAAERPGVRDGEDHER
ncbi:MAG TPA: hypothetical protein VK698_06700 [Kofleriaceae bacterium]|nr:hypothetical protein [Kofleriaceae bacterium]